MNSVRKYSWLLIVVVSLTIAVGIASAAWLTDSGTVDVQVPDRTTSKVDQTTAQGALISYFGDLDTTFGSSGTGVFDPFVRLQASPTEQGYNTNGTVEFDTKVGTWTHAILVSRIPQRPCPQVNPSLTCFELFVDINDSNSTSYISLNKVEVYFTDSATLTGYPFSGSATTSAQYKFSGDILIHDVNQGSGRADLRYDIPINDPAHPITMPPNCDYGNPLCSTYFVLYSQWGTSNMASPDGKGYSSDGGFEEWKVKIYPAIKLTKTPSTTDVCNGSNTAVTFTYVVTNTGTSTVSGPVVDDNGTPADTSDDVTVGTFSGLAAGASQTFTYVFNINGTRTNVATATATDSNGATATSTATATVNGHNCTISLTKTPSATNVCNGTTVTYTYVVTNNSDYFTWTGSLTDDKLGAVSGGSFSLAPGTSKTFTASAAITGAVTNIATAAGAFNDPASTSAQASKQATVTGHVCTISLTKTPSATNVCNGSTVTYTYVVTNNSDYFTWSGSLTDDKLGTISDPLSLTPGQSKTFTASAAITGAVTNIATAAGAFNDPASTSAQATKQATVTGHVCTISLTKTPSATNVCNGTTVTYTYVVTNNSDYFTWSGKLTDDKLGTISDPLSLTPGQSKTFTASAAITGAVTNTATAAGAFNDPASTSAQATKQATVTGHVCTISLTKTPNKTTVCNGSNTPVTYTYVVTNNSDYFTWSGSLTDDKLGSVNGAISLAPGESKTFTATASINGTVTNTATADGTFNDSTPTSAKATASATVTGVNCAQITPTNTTCSDFASGTASTLDALLYTLKSGTINSVAPGVFFYWIGLPASAGANSFTVHQTITTGNFDSHFFGLSSGNFVFDANCNAIASSVTQNGADTVLTFNAASAGTIYLGVKYDATTVKGFAPPTGTGTAHYTFEILGNANSGQGLDLKKK